MTQGWLYQKNIVVMGGTSGMGLAAAKKFIQEGANIISVGKEETVCADARHELGPNATVICADVTHSETAGAAVAACVQQFGSLDGLFHVAGGSGRRMGDGPLHELTLEGWNKTFELNLTSLMQSNQAAIQWWLQHKTGGAILNMSSVLGYSPSPAHFATHAYAASKSAIIGFTKSIAAYYAANNIRANVVAPALVRTPMAERAACNTEIMSFIKTKQPLDGGRMGLPDDISGLACYFLSDYSKFTTAQVVAVDGGWTVSDGQIQPKP